MEAIRISETEATLRSFNPLNAELNPICHLLALLGAHHILHVSRIRVNMGIISISETSVLQPTSMRRLPFSLNRCESLKSVLCSFTCKTLVLFPLHQQIAISDFCREM